jgi:hypothetical protein
MVIIVEDYLPLMRFVELASLKTRIPALIDRMFERLAASKQVPHDVRPAL